jgi:hypothetical protein
MKTFWKTDIDRDTTHEMEPLQEKRDDEKVQVVLELPVSTALNAALTSFSLSISGSYILV